jgi:hypothetical protein
VGIKDRIPQSKDGTFKEDDFVRVLGPPEQPLSRPTAEVVVELMCKMDLCVKQSGAVLIPSLLQVQYFIHH